MTIRILLFDTQGLLLSSGDADLMAQYDPELHLIWIDINGPNNRAFFQDNPQFGIDNLDFDDAHRERHPPQIEFYSDHTYLLTHELKARESYLLLDRSHLLIHVNQQFLITQHLASSMSVNSVIERLNDKRSIESQNMSSICFLIMRQIVTDFLAVMLALEERLNDIEDEIFDASSDDLLAELLAYSSKLQKAKRSFTYHEELLQQMLGNEAQKHIEFDYQQLSYLYNQFERLSSRASLYQGLVSNLINGFISVSAHKTNRVMMTLTLVTAIFLPLTVIAGIYGMNFQHMPELTWQYGYYAILIIMASIVVSGLWIAKLKRWF
ncbi:magnesium transporter CorA family protein [Shewanella inventionis]|uniref:magnesium transporter CorA family protein n=1 Tax=Shewanella inventionis TaxID=1738770 RepID=UPI001CC1B6BE|nr:magnesium transporter CorA family protein [Shewanella inventionis]UAL44630.1 magnesium transporter CorA family protein [Shewanella inventionis]